MPSCSGLGGLVRGLFDELLPRVATSQNGPLARAGRAWRCTASLPKNLHRTVCTKFLVDARGAVSTRCPRALFRAEEMRSHIVGTTPEFLFFSNSNSKMTNALLKTQSPTINHPAAVSLEHQTQTWLTPTEAASHLKVKPRTILAWVRQGKLKGYPLSGTRRHVWRFLQSDLDAALLGSVLDSDSPSVLSHEGRIQ